MPQAVLLLAVSCAAVLAAGVSGQPVSPAAERTNCPAKCGDVEIHYPFGVGPGCSVDAGFEVTCNETTTPPSLQLGNIIIANITLEKAQMVVYTFLTYSCRVPGSNNTVDTQTNSMELSVSTPFLVSPSDNVFTSVGCNSLAQLVGHSGTYYHTGCITTCASVNETADDGAPCSGHGCCEASIMPGLFLVNVSWSDRAEESDYHVPGNLCQYAFVATKGWYKFRKNDLVGNLTFAKRFGEGTVVPLVLDWSISDGRCPPVPQGVDKANIDPYGACVSTQSYCVNASNSATGYFCNCFEGYTGNPYIKNGCKNINECLNKNMYPCHGGRCHDLEGDYECKCNFGRRDDGNKGCEPVLSKAAVAVIGTIIGIALLVVLLIFLLMEREKRKLRDRFNKNGGQLVKSIKIEIFTKAKIRYMTNNYTSIIGQGAFGTVYKGTTSRGENAGVAVKKSTAIKHDWQKESFVNEIRIQSQISHRNLVQLIGCCLETDVPMLVYEFVPRGSLYDVLHLKNDPLPLETRLDIAIYSAVALAYMHTEASQSMAIVHGDVKSANILLDDRFVPKVSDFGTSRLMSMDKDHHTNLVIGDPGYIDPVYVKTGLLTKKSDVYSFSIILLELVTRKKAIYNGNESLPMDYIKASMEGTARQMFDKDIVANSEEHMECLEEVGKIALQCLNENNVNDRPTMREVVDRLKACKSQWLDCHWKKNEVM